MPSEKETLKNPTSRQPGSDVVGNTICPTCLIDDTPSDEDRLASEGETGSHARVALALADLIQSRREHGGRMIGIEGSWGAGKTTVVRLLGKHLATDNNITVFCFDAWAHEGDPLRRTFLESLIRHFQDAAWVDKGKWDNKLEILAHRRRITHTRTIPKTTALGKCFAVAALLIPVGTVFLKSSMDKGVTLGLGLGISWWFVVGLAMTLAPMIVLAWNWLRIRMMSPKSPDDEASTASAWAFLQGDAITETKQDSTETPQPTSVEFEDQFNKLMEDVFPEEKPGRRAVIVLDNLDRIDAKDALSVWSTIQTFLQFRNEPRCPWLSKIWIIVPYDPHGLQKLWHRDGPDANGSKVSKSFLDKSFHLRFEVPPPVLSDWKAFLRKLLADALPAHASEDLDRACWVFSALREPTFAPSPRELKLFVNQLGVIHRQWQHEFPLGHVAYFVRLSREGNNVRETLLKGAYQGLESIVEQGTELTGSLAGLLFNTQATVGRQLLLSTPINTALSNNAAEELRRLAHTHGSGFWAALEDCANSMLGGADAEAVATWALCLEGSGILNAERPEVRSVKERLADAATKTSAWAPFNEEMSKGVSAVCRIAADQSVATKVIESVRKTVSQSDATPITTTVKALVGLAQARKALEKELPKDYQFTLPVDAKGWVEHCPFIWKEVNDWVWLFRPRATFSEVSEFLGASIESAQFLMRGMEFDVLLVAESCGTDLDWERLARSIAQRLNVTEICPSREVSTLLRALTIIARRDPRSASDVAKHLAIDGPLMHWFHLARSQSDQECGAWCIVMFMQSAPGLTSPKSVGNSANGFQILQEQLRSNDEVLATEMVDTVRYVGCWDVFFSVEREAGCYHPLIVRCLRIVADSEEEWRHVFLPSIVREHWRDIRSHINDQTSPDRFSRIVAGLCETTALEDDIRNNDQGFTSGDSGLYLVICQNSQRPEFRQWLRSGLEALDRQTWLDELKTYGEALKLTLALVDEGSAPRLTHEYQDALVSYAEELFDVSVKSSAELQAERSKLFTPLANRDEARQRLLDVAMSRDGRIDAEFVAIFGDEIADARVVLQTDLVVTKLFAPILRVRSVPGLQWLVTLLKRDPALLDRHPNQSSVRSFCERIEDAGRQSEDEASALIEELARILGTRNTTDT